VSAVDTGGLLPNISRHQDAGRSQKGVCSAPHIADLTINEFKMEFDAGTDTSKAEKKTDYYRITEIRVKVQVDVKPTGA
jgi:hypothetical protein